MSMWLWSQPLARLAVGGLVVLFSEASAAQLFEPVSLGGFTEVGFSINGQTTVEGPLPLTTAWSGQGGVGTATAELVADEVLVTFTAGLTNPGVVNFQFGLVDGSIGIPDLGAPTVPIVFDWTLVESDRASTILGSTYSAWEGRFYDSALLGQTTSPVPSGAYPASPPTALWPSFIRGDVVTFDGVNAINGAATFSSSYDFVAPESFTDIFRVRARAIRPAGIADAAAISPAGRVLLAAGLLTSGGILGLRIRGKSESVGVAK